MRMHIDMDDELVQAVDRLAGPRGRSAFVRRAVEEALRHRNRLANLETALGSIRDGGHAWDADAGRWVSDQRFADPGRTG